MPAEQAALTDTRFRRALTQMVRRRVPESDAEDIVQSSLAEALAAANAPTETDALRRFVWGIARHKVADFYRRARREKLDVPEMAAPGAPHTEQDLLRWATRELPDVKDAEQTLEWMLREGEGEKLEAIAEAENLPAPRVRQRVSRLRRHLRERWAVELAALAAIGLVVALIVWEMNRKPGKPITQDAPQVEPPQDKKPDDAPRLKDKAPEPPKSLPGTSDVPNDSRLTPAPTPTPTTPPAMPSSSPPSSLRGTTTGTLGTGTPSSGNFGKSKPASPSKPGPSKATPAPFSSDGSSL